MNLTNITPEDLDQIREWISKDPWHKDDPRWADPSGMLPGHGGLLVFCLSDDKGPLCFVRIDKEGDMVRLITQFGPEEEVSKRRLIKGMLTTGIPAALAFAKRSGYKGVVFESISPTLIAFMERQGFMATSGNDYALVFEEKAHV